MIHNIHNVGRSRAVPSNGARTTRSKDAPLTGKGLPMRLSRQVSVKHWFADVHGGVRSATAGPVSDVLGSEPNRSALGKFVVLVL